MANEVDLFIKVLLIMFILELGIGLISFAVVGQGVPNAPSFSQLNATSTSLQNAIAGAQGAFTCGFNFTNQCQPLQQIQGGYFVSFNFLVDIGDVILLFLIFIFNIILVFFIAIYAIIFLLLDFLPAMISLANFGGLGYIFAFGLPLVIIILAIYAFYLMRNIIGSVTGVIK